MKKILLDMYLKKNLGDDLFLKVICERYPNVKFYVQPSCNYSNTSLKYENLIYKRSIFTKVINFLSRKLKLSNYNIFNMLKRKTDAYMVLGGSMFIEKENFSIENLQKKINYKYLNSDKPYFILGSSFGPYSSKKFKDEYTKVFKNAYDLCFRELYSFNIFNELKSVRYAPDIVFSLDTTNINSCNKKRVVISVIDLTNRSSLSKYKDDYEQKIIEMVNYFQKINYDVLLMSFCKYEGDEKAISSILNKCTNIIKDKIKIYNYNGNISEALNIIASSEYVIATRFHAMILGFLFGKKVLPIIYSNKMKNALEDLKFDGIHLDINDIKEFKINKKINYIKKLNLDINQIKNEAQIHFKKFEEFLGEKEVK